MKPAWQKGTCRTGEVDKLMYLNKHKLVTKVRNTLYSHSQEKLQEVKSKTSEYFGQKGHCQRK